MFLPSLFILLIVKDVHWIRKFCRIYSLTSYLNENSKVYLLVLDSSCNPVSGEHSSLFRSIHLFKTRVMNGSLLEDMGEITMVLILVFLWFSFVFGRLHIYMSIFTLWVVIEVKGTSSNLKYCKEKQWESQSQVIVNRNLSFDSLRLCNWFLNQMKVCKKISG